MYLFRISIPPDTCPGVGLLDHTVALFLVFLRKLHIVLKLEIGPGSKKCNFRVGHLLFDEGLLWTLSEHSILPHDKILSLFHHIPVVEQLSEDAE